MFSLVIVHYCKYLMCSTCIAHYQLRSSWSLAKTCSPPLWALSRNMSLLPTREITSASSKPSNTKWCTWLLETTLRRCRLFALSRLLKTILSNLLPALVLHVLKLSPYWDCDLFYLGCDYYYGCGPPLEGAQKFLEDPAAWGCPPLEPKPDAEALPIWTPEWPPNAISRFYSIRKAVSTTTFIVFGSKTLTPPLIQAFKPLTKCCTRIASSFLIHAYYLIS